MKKTAVITGALGNLGRATTQSFKQHDFQVVGLDRAQSLEQAPQGVEDEEYHGVDLIDVSAAKALLDKICADKKPIHAGVMIAGGFGMGSVTETETSEIQKMIALNFETAYNTMQALWPYMADGARFIFIGAKPALEPAAGHQMTAYALSKSLVFRLAEMVNEAGKERGITATVIVPSIIDTPPNRESMPDANFDDWVRPEEIGDMIAYLCSDKGRAVRNSVVKMYANS